MSEQDQDHHNSQLQSCGSYFSSSLRHTFPDHKESVLSCSKCLPPKDKFVVHYKSKIFSTFDQYYQLECTVCKCFWFVCKLCPGQRSRYHTLLEAQRHIRQKHPEGGKNNPEPQTFDLENDNQILPSLSSDDSVSLFPFCTDAQEQYFSRNDAIINKDSDYGLRYLVSKAVSKDGSESQMQSFTTDHVRFHSNVALLSSRLTPAEKQYLNASYYHLAKLAEAGYKIDDSLVPTTEKLLNQRYLKGKHSFMRNIPKPEVKNIGRHGYVSLKSCVADFLARHDFELEEILSFNGNSVTRISQSERAQEILDSMQRIDSSKLKEPHVKRLVLHLIEWSDDFDPAKSIKDNRGSAWIKSVTISPLHSSRKEFTNTYPIAIGAKNDAHDEVEEEFARELEELRSGNLQFRVGKYGTLVYVYADMLACLQDQIERRSMNYIMLGGSNHSARWGHVCDFSAISNLLPACETCWKSLASELTLSPTCCGLDCLNWETDGSCYKKPKSYPSDIDVGENGLRSKKLTYETLSAAVEKTIDSMLRQRLRWTKTAATSYLSSEGINGDLMEKIFKHVQKKKAAINANKTDLPIWSSPILWRRGVSLSCHLDVPMHLVFLGIVKSTITTINEWISSHGWNLIVESRTNITLDNIKSLNLNWCRSIPLWRTGSSRQLSTSGWVSENYLAMTRLTAWYYSELIYKVTPSESSEEFTKIAMLVTSLRAMVSRVMTRSVDKNILSDTRRHIKIFLQCFHEFTKVTPTVEQKPKPKPKPKKSSCKRKRPGKLKETNNETLHQRNDSLVQTQQADKHNRSVSRPVKKRSRKAKCDNDEPWDQFSESSAHQDEQQNEQNQSAIQPPKQKSTSRRVPPWISKYNFVCLLNIPDVMKKFGPIRNYWEGGIFGEKILQVAKGTWYGFTTNWARNMLRNMIDTFSLKRTVHSLNPANPSNDDGVKVSVNDIENESVTSYDRASYHVYRSTEHVIAEFNSGVPMSVVILRDDIGIIVKKNLFMSVYIHVDDFETRISHTYFTCSLWNCRELDISKADILAYGLMLPLYEDSSHNGDLNLDKWTVVTSEWKDIFSDGRFVFPRVWNCTYKSTSDGYSYFPSSLTGSLLQS